MTGPNTHHVVAVIVSFVAALLPITGCGSETRSPAASDSGGSDSSIADVGALGPAQFVVSRAEYRDRLHGFWLGQSLANWTGLITEMDKLGGSGKDGRGAGFYTREDWGGPDGPNIWGAAHLDALSDTIGYYFVDEGGMWGADDDTDIEYLYQYITYHSGATRLSAEQIRNGWLKHIYSDDNTPFVDEHGNPENYLWVSNQTAHDLMRQGMSPPSTSHPDVNPYYEMIDAQLTTEIFGLFAPGRPDIALDLAYLPIRTTARQEAASIAEFYVIMHALAPIVESEWSRQKQLHWMADHARRRLADGSYAAGMYDLVRSLHASGVAWEAARDSLFERYQVRQQHGYDIPTRDPVCNGCFAAGINFGASLVSLFYGEGDIRETIKIGALAGWDSDNPTATWGGLLGFMLGKKELEKVFGRTFADRFHIHRTRGGFPSDVDTFDNMAQLGVFIVDRVVREEMGGRVDFDGGRWYIPGSRATITPLQPGS